MKMNFITQNRKILTVHIKLLLLGRYLVAGGQRASAKPSLRAHVGAAAEAWFGLRGGAAALGPRGDHKRPRCARQGGHESAPPTDRDWWRWWDAPLPTPWVPKVTYWRDGQPRHHGRPTCCRPFRTYVGLHSIVAFEAFATDAYASHPIRTRSAGLQWVQIFLWAAFGQGHIPIK